MKIHRALALASWLLSASVLQSQDIGLELHGLMVTDRATGVRGGSPPGRGFGGGAALEIGVGNLVLEGSATLAHLSRGVESGIGFTTGFEEASTDGWDVTQVEVRLRYFLVGPIAVEASAVRQMLSPDFDGEEMGFASAGLFGQLALAPGARAWARFGLIPYARFSGAGANGFAAETQFGVFFPVSGKVSIVARYAYQRIDRDMVSGDTSNLEFDFARIGIRIGSPGRERQ